MYKLKTTYSTDLAEDLKTIHGIAADAELERILSYEIAAELKREGIDPNEVTIERTREGNTVFFTAKRRGE